MKAQFATIEAMVSLAMALSAAASISYAVGGYAHYYSVESSNLSMYVAAHDMLHQFSANEVAMQCLSYYISGNTSCMAYYTALYMETYKLNAVAVLRGNGTQDYSKIYCGLAGSNTVCVGVS